MMSTIPVAPRWASSAYRSSLRNYTDVANQSVFRGSDGFRDRLIAAQDFVGISWTGGFRKYQLRLEAVKESESQGETGCHG
jgi:hypothetical protein